MTRQRDEAAGVTGVPRSIATSLLAEAAVVGGGLYYFGYLRTRSAFAYFGIDPSILGLSTPDYLLRSVNSVGIPLLVCALGYLAVRTAVAAAPRLGLGRYTLGRGGALVALGAAGVVGVLGLGGIAIGQFAGRNQIGTASAVLLALAFLVTGGAVRGLRDPAEYEKLAFAAYCVVAILIFVAATGFATSVGQHDAARIARTLHDRPTVTLRSENRLDISGYGVTEVTGTDPHYAYRYDNLRLLARTGGQYLFIPPDWRYGAPVFIVPGGDGLRLDVVATRSLL
jgi:hypothetical protein